MACEGRLRVSRSGKREMEEEDQEKMEEREEVEEAGSDETSPEPKTEQRWRATRVREFTTA